MDIIIYTTLDVLEYKKGGDGFWRYYWGFPRAPKELEEGDWLYFACSGLIQGHFTIDVFDPDDDEMICWEADSWVELEVKIPTKSFQGFKYANKVKELNLPTPGDLGNSGRNEIYVR
jgi:hypothetical protein